MARHCPSNLSDIELVDFIEHNYPELPEPIHRAIGRLADYATPRDGKHVKARLTRHGRDHHKVSER